MLDDLLKENGIEGGCLRMYMEKYKQPNCVLLHACCTVNVSFCYH